MHNSVTRRFGELKRVSFWKMNFMRVKGYKTYGISPLMTRIEVTSLEIVSKVLSTSLLKTFCNGVEPIEAQGGDHLLADRPVLRREFKSG
jgi:hypothetical protein